MSEDETPRTIYLLHFEQPVRGCLHYLGITESTRLFKRLREHCGPYGSNLTSQAARKGVRFHCVEVWPNATFVRERQMKRISHLSKRCWMCHDRAPELLRVPIYTSNPKAEQEFPWRAVEWAKPARIAHSHHKKKGQTAN